jgi:hypothetical protein
MKHINYITLSNVDSLQIYKKTISTLQSNLLLQQRIAASSHNFQLEKVLHYRFSFMASN